MQLRNKALIILSISWITFFAVSITYPIQQYLIGYLAIVLLLAGISIWLIRSMVLDRIENLSSQIETLSIEKTTPIVVETSANDEVTALASQANQIIDKSQSSPQEMPVPTIQDVKVTSIDDEAAKNPLARFARYDEDSLPNRVLFNELLNKSISHAKRHNKILAILIIDIESAGNAEADNIRASALKEIGTRLQNTLRTDDVLAKLDGNEFIVLLNDIGKPKFASVVAEKLLQACSPVVSIDYKDLFLKVSVGISIYPNDGGALEELVENAYKALYTAKRLSSDTFQFHTEEMDLEAREFIRLDNDLRKAISNKELVLYYQPKLNVKTGNITSVEALIRWMHPQLGIINPMKFIPVAEETGLIFQIGEWALREACITNKKWQEEGYEHISVSLNLSSHQFHHPKIAQTIASVLKETDLSPNYLELEINESTIMSDLAKAVEILNRIKATGVQISLDHFGTGYTSIRHLKQLPITIVKIDQDFIRGIPTNIDDMAITTALIALSHTLGLKVVAEGVESAEQVQFLASQNCDLMQGYYLSYPEPVRNITQQFSKLMDKVLI